MNAIKIKIFDVDQYNMKTSNKIVPLDFMLIEMKLNCR